MRPPTKHQQRFPASLLRAPHITCKDLAAVVQPATATMFLCVLTHQVSSAILTRSANPLAIHNSSSSYALLGVLLRARITHTPAHQAQLCVTAVLCEPTSSVAAFPHGVPEKKVVITEPLFLPRGSTPLNIVETFASCTSRSPGEAASTALLVEHSAQPLLSCEAYRVPATSLSTWRDRPDSLPASSLRT